MYNKQQIIENINSSGQYIDAFMLDAFIKNWKIEAIYEDENGVEFYDDDAFEKIKSSIAPKDYSADLVKEEVGVVNYNEQPQEQQEFQEEKQEIVEQLFDNVENNEVQDVQVEYEEIVNEENKEQVEFVENQEVQEEQIVEVINETIENPVVEQVVKNYPENEIKNVTLDITNQTLGVLAESIASKITTDIAKYLKDIDFLQEAMDMGAFKKDNEILAKKVQEIINDNKILVSRIKELESQKTDYVHVFGNIYIKKNSK